MKLLPGHFLKNMLVLVSPARLKTETKAVWQNTTISIRLENKGVGYNAGAI